MKMKMEDAGFINTKGSRADATCRMVKGEVFWLDGERLYCDFDRLIQGIWHPFQAKQPGYSGPILPQWGCMTEWEVEASRDKRGKPAPRWCLVRELPGSPERFEEIQKYSQYNACQYGNNGGALFYAEPVSARLAGFLVRDRGSYHGTERELGGLEDVTDAARKMVDGESFYLWDQRLHFHSPNLGVEGRNPFVSTSCDGVSRSITEEWKHIGRWETDCDWRGGLSEKNERWCWGLSAWGAEPVCIQIIGYDLHRTSPYRSKEGQFAWAAPVSRALAAELSK